jgi:hypothetical protein
MMWRLDPPGGGAASYLVGTVHLIDDRLEPAIERALVRLAETGALAVERRGLCHSPAILLVHNHERVLDPRVRPRGVGAEVQFVVASAINGRIWQRQFGTRAATNHTCPAACFLTN